MWCCIAFSHAPRRGKGRCTMCMSASVLCSFPTASFFLCLYPPAVLPKCVVAHERPRQQLRRCLGCCMVLRGCAGQVGEAQDPHARAEAVKRPAESVPISFGGDGRPKLAGISRFLVASSCPLYSSGLPSRHRCRYVRLCCCVFAVMGYVYIALRVHTCRPSQCAEWYVYIR